MKASLHSPRRWIHFSTLTHLPKSPTLYKISKPPIINCLNLSPPLLLPLSTTRQGRRKERERNNPTFLHTLASFLICLFLSHLTSLFSLEPFPFMSPPPLPYLALIYSRLRFLTPLFTTPPLPVRMSGSATSPRRPSALRPPSNAFCLDPGSTDHNSLSENLR